MNKIFQDIRTGSFSKAGNSVILIEIYKFQILIRAVVGDVGNLQQHWQSSAPIFIGKS